MQTEANPDDGIDNDCDGAIDEEILDRRDNDEDRYIDEDIQKVVKYNKTVGISVCMSVCSH